METEKLWQLILMMAVSGFAIVGCTQDWDMPAGRNQRPPAPLQRDPPGEGSMMESAGRPYHAKGYTNHRQQMNNVPPAQQFDDSRATQSSASLHSNKGRMTSERPFPASPTRLMDVPMNSPFMSKQNDEEPSSAGPVSAWHYSMYRIPGTPRPDAPVDAPPSTALLQDVPDRQMNHNVKGNFPKLVHISTFPHVSNYQDAPVPLRDSYGVQRDSSYPQGNSALGGHIYNPTVIVSSVHRNSGENLPRALNAEGFEQHPPMGARKAQSDAVITKRILPASPAMGLFPQPPIILHTVPTIVRSFRRVLNNIPALVRPHHGSAAAMNYGGVRRQPPSPPRAFQLDEAAVGDGGVPPVSGAPDAQLPPMPSPALTADTSSQYHSQNQLGQYVYGYSNPLSAKKEMRSVDGVVQGSYTYLDAAGVQQTISYVADKDGFRLTDNTQ